MWMTIEQKHIKTTPFKIKNYLLGHLLKCFLEVHNTKQNIFREKIKKMVLFPNLLNIFDRGNMQTRCLLL